MDPKFHKENSLNTNFNFKTQILNEFIKKSDPKTPLL